MIVSIAFICFGVFLSVFDARADWNGARLFSFVMFSTSGGTRLGTRNWRIEGRARARSPPAPGL